MSHFEIYQEAGTAVHPVHLALILDKENNNEIDLCVVDENGERVNEGLILSITQNGTFYRGTLPPRFGFKLGTD